MSFVLVAASLRSCAPMFSNGSSSSISFATVTPSWVTVGAPNFLSSATLRPFGPSVVLTALASVSTPSFSDCRAAVLNSRTFATIRSSWECERRAEQARPLLADDRQNVLLGQDQQIFLVEFEFGAGVLRKQDFIADLDVHRHPLAVFIAPTLTGGDDRAPLRLFLGRIRQDDAGLGRFFASGRLDHDAIAERLQLGGGRRSVCLRHCLTYLL